MKSPKQLNGRLALVTGASRGLGRAVALAFAREGAQVIICGRAEGALEEVDDEIRSVGGKATILKLDLRAGDRIDQLGPTLYQRFGKLDIFVASAGILGPLSPLPHVTAEAWSAVIDINLNANWRLIRTLDPLLKISDAGRAIFVTSGAAAGDTAYWGPYAVSKAGLQTLATTYAAECATTRIQVSVINPGPVRTAMRAKAFPGEDPLTLPAPEEVAPLFVDLALPSAALNGEVVSFKAWKQSRQSQTSNNDA
jgi:NAD(P)-dependent dehydrogenase (short-subunit alcohol dehydrogenase family)